MYQNVGIFLLSIQRFNRAVHLHLEFKSLMEINDELNHVPSTVKNLIDSSIP